MTSISPATSLATFQTSHASSSKSRSHVYLSEVRNSTEQLAVLTVQGDGIWTYDLQILRPTTSFTVPPSTTFSTPAVSFYPWISQSSREKEKQRAIDGDEDMDEAPSNERITTVVVAKGEGVKKSDEGRTLWYWRNDEGEKEVMKLDGPPIQNLIHLERQSGLLAVQSFSALTYIDSKFSVIPITSPLRSAKDQVVLAADFLNIKGDWRLIMVDSKGGIVIGKLDFQTCTMEILHEGSLAAGEVDLARAEIDADGGITAISSNNEVIAVDFKDIRSPSFPPSPILASPESSQWILPLPYHSKSVALIPSQSTSTIALAITSPDAPAILTTTPILLGDVNTSSIVDMRILSRPSSFSWIIGFVITHKHAQGDSGRSIVYTAEVTLPEKGIGLNLLLGSQARSALYFKSASREENGEEGANGLIRQIESALAQSGDAMDARVANAETVWLSQGSATHLSESEARRLVSIVFAAALRTSASDGEAISSTKTPRRVGPYAKRIIADLLDRRLLNDSMLSGGLLSKGLLPCGDWDLIPRAIELLPTISSASVISCLVATLHPVTVGTPAFEELYAQVLRLPPPPPTWRVDMRRFVSVENATVFLKTLSTWASEHVTAQSTLSTWDAPALQSSIPPLPAVLNHASLLLDSHLALFLSHAPSHAALEILQETIVPLLEAQNDYRALRAPIEALLTLSDRAQRDKEESAARRDAQRPIDRKRGGRTKGGYAELRTEVIGKWRVEDFAF